MDGMQDGMMETDDGDVARDATLNAVQWEDEGEDEPDEAIDGGARGEGVRLRRGDHRPASASTRGVHAVERGLKTAVMEGDVIGGRA